MNRVQLKKFLVEKYETYNCSFFSPVKDLFRPDFRLFMTTLLRVIDERINAVQKSHIATRAALNSKREFSAFSPYEVQNRRLFKEIWRELSTQISKKQSESWAKYFAEITRDAMKYDANLKKRDLAQPTLCSDPAFFNSTRFSDEAISQSRRITPAIPIEANLLKERAIAPEDEGISKSL